MSVRASRYASIQKLNNERLRIIGMKTLAALLLALTSSAPLYALADNLHTPARRAPELPTSERAEVETLLDRELQQAVESEPLLPGQKKVVITTTLNPGNREMLIDLGRDAVPATAGAASERQCHFLMTEAISILKDAVRIDGYTCTYGGKDIFYYHPDLPATTPAADTTKEERQDGPPVVVMVSAGHGYFYNGVSRQWETRRPLMNGMREDFVTPYFARDVAGDLINKSHMSVAKARTNEATIHAPSNQPWWRMSARTWLESQYPDNPEIWNSLNNDNDPDGQEDDDIRARPLFANHVNASYSLHIHTNGSTNTSIRGTLGFYQRDRQDDARFVARILCSMKETIQAHPFYRNWSVDLQPRYGNYGELRLTDPSKRAALIEVGFHSNAQDATALKSEAFRTAAAAGMAKGIRLYHEGKNCETFKIDSIPDVIGSVNTPFSYLISYSGNPTYPVKVYSQPVSCPSGWSCSRFHRTVNSPTRSPITQEINCSSNNVGQSGTFRYKRWLVDADGVSTAPFEQTYTCNAAM